MNDFTHKNTAIIESEFDFSRVHNTIKFSGEVCLATTISIPKDPKNNKIVVLTLDLSMGSKEDEIQLHVKSRSFFEITKDVDIETLRDDVKEQCYPVASQELSQRIAELTSLHIGKPMNISIPSEF